MRRVMVEVKGFEHTASPGTVMQNNTESSKGKAESVRHEIGITRMVDLGINPGPTTMETDEHGGGAEGGVAQGGSEDPISQIQNLDALNGDIDGNINSETVTSGYNTIQPRQAAEMERINKEVKTPVVKPNNMDVGESARIEEGVTKGGTYAMFDPNIKFTVGNNRQPNVSIVIARANRARGRSTHKKLATGYQTKSAEAIRG